MKLKRPNKKISKDLLPIHGIIPRDGLQEAALIAQNLLKAMHKESSLQRIQKDKKRRKPNRKLTLGIILSVGYLAQEADQTQISKKRQ